MPHLIKDEAPRLAKELQEALLSRDLQSPFVSRIRHRMGSDYEKILEQRLRAMSIPFMTESDLRERGYEKLHIPFGIWLHLEIYSCPSRRPQRLSLQI